jgi:SAM-dependent methyltransferase
MSKNLDEKTVRDFGQEWRQFDQSQLSPAERREHFDRYFAVFPRDRFHEGAAGIDIGCGTGRWAIEVAPRVGKLHLVDASPAALAVARTNLARQTNCEFHLASVEALPVEDGSMDFAYSLGVLHHVPDTLGGLTSCVRKLKPGAPLLVYLYYALDDRPPWFRALWRGSDLLRRLVSRLPHRAKWAVSTLVAAVVYLPFARAAKLLERRGRDVDGFPLGIYRHRSFYSMRTDSLDRFGTRLEKRFRRDEIQAMLEAAGLHQIRFSEDAPYWCAVGYRPAAAASS